MNETRLENLGILIGRYGGGYGAPDCGNFAELVKIPRKKLSAILCRTTPPWPHTAQIESALGLSKGWTDEDLSFLFQSTTREIDLYRQISSMTEEKQLVLSQIAKLLS